MNSCAVAGIAPESEIVEEHQVMMMMMVVIGRGVTPVPSHQNGTETASRSKTGCSKPNLGWPLQRSGDFAGSHDSLGPSWGGAPHVQALSEGR